MDKSASLREILHRTISNGGFVSLISCDELVAPFPGSQRIKETVPQRSKSWFLKGVRLYSVILLDLPAGERSRL